MVDVGAETVEAGVGCGRRNAGNWIGKGAGVELLLQLVGTVGAEDPPAILDGGATGIGGEVVCADEGGACVEERDTRGPRGYETEEQGNNLAVRSCALRVEGY